MLRAETPSDGPTEDLESQTWAPHLSMIITATISLLSIVDDLRGQHWIVVMPERNSCSVWATRSKVNLKGVYSHLLVYVVYIEIEFSMKHASS